MVRMNETRIEHRPPPTEEERARALETLDRIQQMHTKLLAARGGEWFPGAVEVLRELRGEKDADVP